MSIALIGPSGAGKGTYGSKVAAQFGLVHISTGDLFRESVEKGSPLGLMAQKYFNRGDLVPDEVVDALLEEWLRKVDLSQDFLFDGFPRTAYQAHFLETIFAETNRKLDMAIYLHAPDDILTERLIGRLICRQCRLPFHKNLVPFQGCPHNQCTGQHLYQRSDDQPDIIQVRLDVFHRESVPLLAHYQQQGKLVIIKTEGEIKQVYKTIVEAIEAVKRKESLVSNRKEFDQLQRLPDISPLFIPQEAYPTIDLVLLAPPGSGKGTQAEQLRKKIGLQHIATGDIFRENLKEETELGKMAKTYMDRGELVPDDVTHAMVEDRLARPDISNGFIMDGFPRTKPQAEALTQMLHKINRRLDVVLYLNVSDEEIMTRLSGRLICRNCQTPYHLKFKPPAEEGVCDLCEGELYRRTDDNPETIRARLRTYRGQTAPLIEYYRQAGLLIEIEGEGEVSQVTRRIMAAIDDLVQAALTRRTAQIQAN